MTSSCNSGCTCKLKEYIPVCGKNNITYYDPCHAGCTEILANKVHNLHPFLTTIICGVIAQITMTWISSCVNTAVSIWEHLEVQNSEI